MQYFNITSPTSIVVGKQVEVVINDDGSITCEPVDLLGRKLTKMILRFAAATNIPAIPREQADFNQAVLKMIESLGLLDLYARYSWIAPINRLDVDAWNRFITVIPIIKQLELTSESFAAAYVRANLLDWIHAGGNAPALATVEPTEAAWAWWCSLEEDGLTFDAWNYLIQRIPFVLQSFARRVATETLRRKAILDLNELAPLTVEKL
jgi:hypothetical protein